jgi:hypothetical protein
MDHAGHRRSSIIVAFAVTLLMLGAESVWSQDRCCFTNRRYSGICSVVPEPGQTCTGILAYLNSLSSAGKSYCGNTEIRSGWALVSCDGGSTGGAGASSAPRNNRAGAPPVSPTGGIGLQVVQPQQPQVIRPGGAPVVIPSGLVMQVHVDQPVAEPTWGQTVTVFLDQDLMTDGAVVVPAGSSVRGRVSQPDPAVAVDPSELLLQLESVVVDGEERPLVGEGTASSIGVSLPISAVGSDEIELGPATPLLPKDESLRLSAESIKSYRQAIVAANLQLSALESVSFWPLYREYQTAVEAVNARRFQLFERFVASYGTLEDEQAAAMLEESLAIEQSFLGLKRTWLPRFREILPDTKVVRFIQIEDKLETVAQTGLEEMVPLVR